MTAKEIFESIDLSQLPKDAADKFRKVEKATKGFTIESEKVNTFMRGAYKKIKESKPTALKNLKVEEKIIKKEVKKGKTTEVVENLEYKVKGTKKVSKKTPTPSKPKRSGETAMERARKIRKKGEAWKDALARAQKELKAEATKAKKDAEKVVSTTSQALKNLEKMIQNDPKLKGYPRTYGKQSKRIDANKDAKIKAKPAGKRVSKKGHKNQYGESKGGRVYWENRDNRSDRYAPNFPNKVYLEMGGETDDLGFPTGHTFLVVEVSPDGTKNLIKSTKDYMTALMSSAVARGMKSNKDARVVIVDKEDKKVIHEAFEAGGEITITPTQLINNPDALVGTTSMTELFECGGVTAYQEGGEVFVTPNPLLNAGSGDYVAGSNTMSNMFEDGGEVIEYKGGQVSLGMKKDLEFFEDIRVKTLISEFKHGILLKYGFVVPEDAKKYEKESGYKFKEDKSIAGVIDVRSNNVMRDVYDGDKFYFFFNTSQPDRVVIIDAFDGDKLSATRADNKVAFNALKLELLDLRLELSGKKMAKGGELSQEVPKFLYHATYEPLLPSIKKTGLNTSKAKKAWEDSEAGVVYLANDPYVAESYAETSEMVDEDWLDQIVILKVDSKDLDLSKLKDDRNVRSDEPSDTFEYHGVIPWKKLKVHMAKGGFIAMYNGKRVEIEAETLLDAKKKAIQELKVPKSKQGLLSVMSNASMQNEDFRFMAKGGKLPKNIKYYGVNEIKEYRLKNGDKIDPSQTFVHSGIYVSATKTMKPKEKEFQQKLEFASGGKINWKEDYDYIPRYNIEEVELENGKVIKGDYVVSGIYKPKSDRTKQLEKEMKARMKKMETGGTIVAADPSAAMEDLNQTYGYESVYAKGGNLKRFDDKIADLNDDLEDNKETIEETQEFLRDIYGKEMTYQDRLKYTYAKGGVTPKAHIQKLANDLWDRKGYDLTYLEKLSEKELKSLWDTEFFYEDEFFEKGGRLGFEGLAKKVAKRYEGKAVKPKYQEEYGKTYSKEEALEVGRKVAAKVYGQQQANMKKMAKGGVTKGDNASDTFRTNDKIKNVHFWENKVWLTGKDGKAYKIDLDENTRTQMNAKGGSLDGHGLQLGDKIVEDLGSVLKVTTKDGGMVYVDLASGYRGKDMPLPFAKGGAVGGMKIPDIAKKFGKTTADVMKQVEIGAKHEMEHTSDAKKARKIALDHLSGDLDYYTKLKKLGL